MEAYATEILDRMSDALCAVDEDWCIIYVNDKVEQVWGKRRDEVLGKNIWQELPQFSGTTVYHELITAMQQRRSVKLEYLAPRANHWFDLTAYPSDRGLVVYFRDITERKHAEERLAYHARVLDQVYDAIVATDTRLVLTAWNRAAEEMYGWKEAEVLGRDVREVVRSKFENDRRAEGIRLLAATGYYALEESIHYRKDGSQIHVEGRIISLRDAAEQVTGYVCAYRDITERKQAEAERERLLQEAQQARQEAESALQMRDQFLSIASHELRTPLTPLLGYTALLRQTMAQGLDAQQQRLLETIERQADRLNTLIGTLLDVARLQRGQFTIEPQLLDLVVLTSQVVDEFRLMLQAENPTYTVTLHVPAEAVMVDGDPSRLEEVLHNLLSNAVKYTPVGGSIRVCLARWDAKAVLEVVDKGIGIPAEEQTRLFEPFYRGKNPGSSSSGFGLGLYIAQEIIQRHAGRIEVVSAPGQGSTFRVILPLHA